MAYKSKPKNLPVKTFVDDSAEGIDKQVNDFRKDNVIFAMQPNATATGVDGKLTLVYTAYYITKEEYAKQKKTEKYFPCPKCGKSIPKIFVKHDCGWKSK